MATSEVGSERAGRRELAARVEDLSQTYVLPTGAVPALADVHLDVPAQQLTVVAGPSGSGKSTLLRILGLVEAAGSGRVEVAGQRVDEASDRVRRRLRRRHIAFVFQRPLDNLVDDLDATEQLELAARLRGDGGGPADLSILEVLGLAHRATARTRTLSGGEQQRLALAAAFASRPSLIVADEPTAQLDRAAATRVIDALAALRDLGATVVVSSHDAAVVGAADQVVRLASGRVVEPGEGRRR